MDQLVSIYLVEQRREQEERASMAAIAEESVEDQVEEENEIV